MSDPNRSVTDKNGSSVAVELTDGVLTLTLQRPESLNSIDRALADALLRALEEADRNPEVRALLLTGAGRGFCAGQDLAELTAPDAPEPEQIVRQRYNPLIQALRNSRLPSVCAVNGVAAGAGSSLALACDITLAARTATFVQSFIKVGLLPDSGGTYFLPRLVGRGRAAALAMLGEKLSAEEAERIGLIYKATAPEELLQEAWRIAETLAALPPRGLKAIREALDASFNNDLPTQLALEERLQGALGRTEDYREGVRAFIEKRPPRFTGR